LYQTPTSADFQRILLRIVHNEYDLALSEERQIQAQHAAKGLGQSGSVVVAVTARLDELHAKATDNAMCLISDFIVRTQRAQPELSELARAELEKLTTKLIEQIPPLSLNPQATQQLKTKYNEKFQTRIDEALRGIEIGFIGGRDVSVQQAQNIQANAFKLLKAFERETRGVETPVLLHQIRDLEMTEGEAQSAFLYLKDKKLIDANFNIFNAARISAAGHDAICEAETKPDKASHAFPAITYNYLNIHTMTGSNIQQGTKNSHITANQAITTQELAAGVKQLVEQLDRLLLASPLPSQLQGKATQAINELRAASHKSVPDAGRLRRGLESLRHVLEHATGHLIAAGALQLIAQLLGVASAH
jgi:hypothetical protein